MMHIDNQWKLICSLPHSKNKIKATIKPAVNATIACYGWNREENARLISAVPDMFKALEKTLKLIEYMQIASATGDTDIFNDSFVELQKHRSLINKVIAKAKGSS